jgi:hypothetical protein
VLTHEAIGGLGGLYAKALAVEMAGESYIKGNYLGSAPSVKSKKSIIFAIIIKFGNLALVTMGILKNSILFEEYFTDLFTLGYSFLAEVICLRNPCYRSRIWP